MTASSASLGVAVVHSPANANGSPPGSRWYNGHPLYLFAGDRKPGDLNGQGLNAFGGRWLALSPTGDPITLQPPAGAGTGGY